MIQIKIGNDTYQVDETPWKELALKKAEELINMNEHPFLKEAVGAACKMAIGALGWDKPRDVGSLQFMSEKLVELVFTWASENGVELKGEKLALDVVNEITAPVAEAAPAAEATTETQAAETPVTDASTN